MKKLLFAVLIAGMVLISGCTQQDWQTQESRLNTGAVDLSGFEPDKLSLTKHYLLESLDITLKVPQYTLPLQNAQIYNFQDFSSKISLSPEALELLNKNGFVVVQNPFNPQEEDITAPYKTLELGEIPVFITSDSLLHLYHIQFDETLRQIEEREFYDKVWEISKELLDDSVEKYQASTGELNEATRRNAAYFAVGLELLKPKPDQIQEECSEQDWECLMSQTDTLFTQEERDKYVFTVPGFVSQDVASELALIEKHSGMEMSPIFNYKEDYSQYVPRGHYTRSEKLKNYFKAMMWYGRISFLLKGCEFDCLVSEEDARLQTMGASLITSRFAESQDLKDKWDRIYTVTAFYVGLSDDLGPYEYLESIGEIFGSPFDPNDLNENSVKQLKARLAEYEPPKIYGGTGACEIDPPFNPEQADECLENTKGFRLMGQRFIPDSYMFQNLVFPKAGSYLGSEEPFTREMTQAGYVRAFPRGLDVMALLGSERASDILDELDDSNYVNYTARFNELKEEFDEFTDAEWNRNLYWSWLYSLKPLLKDFGEGYPTFMQTQAWQDKELTTALASWTELRHDTILYAKQSYTPMATSMPVEKPVVGYVEPVPEFYNRLLALTRMTTQGLDEMEVLDDISKSRLESLEGILERLVEISTQELENKELSQEDYDFIKRFGQQLNGVIAGVDDKAKKTTIVADVHTDINTGQALEEGVGYVDMMVVAYIVPDGRILLGAGPVMTYYEFKQPMSDRLTDEAWRDMLQDDPPEKPEWIPNFSV